MHSPYEKVKLKLCIHHTILVKEQQEIDNNFHLLTRDYIWAKKDAVSSPDTANGMEKMMYMG